MAKSGDKSAIEAPGSGNPDSGNPGTGVPGSGTDVLVDLAPTHMFRAGPQTMLLGPDDVSGHGTDYGTAADYVSLSLGDLLPDTAGEVVLLAGEDMPINLTADQPLTGAGIAPEHVTEGGVDVTGLNFYSFESGLTVYSPVDLLILNAPELG